MARTSWFDQESNELGFSKYLERMDSWQDALADGVVTPEELEQQMQRVIELLRNLEPKLSNELHAELTTIFYELAVFYGMERIAEAQLAEGA
jgi:hypothetical protein